MNLKTTVPVKERFTKMEVAIRDNFDCFLSYFERFEHFIEAGLFTPAELKSYLRYWIDTISEDIKDDVRNFINDYIDKYKCKGTQNLFKRFNKNIFPSTEIETTRIL